MFLCVVKRAMAPLAPGRGEGPGVRGDSTHQREFFLARALVRVLSGVEAVRGVFLTTEVTVITEERQRSVRA